MRRNNKFKLSPLYRENFNVAIRSIMANKLRSSLTIAIIAVGITSLVGILTSISALRANVEGSFGKMGANSFRLVSSYSSTPVGQRILNRRNISYSQSITFKENYSVDALVSIYTNITGQGVVGYKADKTNPNISVMAADIDYIDIKKAVLDRGRSISDSDISTAAQVCVIGSGVVKELFEGVNPVDQVVSIQGNNYKVIGTLESEGQSFGGGMDNSAIIPVTNARANFLNDDSYFTIEVMPNSAVDNQFAIDEAMVLLRAIRRLSPQDISDFRVVRNDQMYEQMQSTMRTLTIAAAVIGLITMLGAAVGLMNIMLVSVKERTREIGTKKALGAKSFLIKQQFLIESIVIGQMGGILGIVLGILIGNGVALLTESALVMPWMWIFGSVILCLFVSMSSAYIPAKRAAALDPIESLRYE